MLRHTVVQREGHHYVTTRSCGTFKHSQSNGEPKVVESIDVYTFYREILSNLNKTSGQTQHVQKPWNVPCLFALQPTLPEKTETETSAEEVLPRIKS